jgi:hypothetical protein
MHELVSFLILKGERGIGGDEHQVGFRRVHPTQHEFYLGFAMGYCRSIGRSGELEAMQAFWPDSHGNFPFEVGCDLAVYQLQPRLVIGPTPREVQRSLKGPPSNKPLDLTRGAFHRSVELSGSGVDARRCGRASSKHRPISCREA